MPNIFNRPMFRRGGSAAKGTGITSGLTPRQKYETAGPVIAQTDPRYGLYSSIRKQYLPGSGQNYQDFLTGFGASGADVKPGELQTWGQALGKGASVAAGLKQKREDALMKFDTEIAKQVLTQDEKDQLLRYANEYSKILEAKKTRPLTTQEQSRLIFLTRYLKGVETKTNWTNRLLTNKDNLMKRKIDGGMGYDNAQATRVSQIMTEMEKGSINIQAAFGPKDSNYEGSIPGNYIDPNKGVIVYWDGKTAKQIWPTK